jgi:hypothetical protein
MDELAHLEVVLNKQPVIGTWTAQDLLDRPEMVRENYLGHVRSFVVLGRLQVSSDDEQMSVAEYEKRVIKLVKEKGAAKGYITAEYGYGKTSTALFIWQRCEEAEILAVPPFQLQKLDHLLSATYGWVRFNLAGSYPQLVDEATQIYQRYINRGIDAEAKTESERQLLRRAYAEGRYNPELKAIDYIRFFEEMTELVLKARYSGLVVIADELQQYIDPDIKAGVRDPLTPLFDIIQALITRKGQLPFALLLSVPRKELGLMNDQRGDLVQRLKGDKLALDLGVIYNQTFARDLWDQLAHELEFESLKHKIVVAETLEALGQISARADLATGPRTVVDVFKLMTRRYIEHAGAVEPFSPLDLVNAFLSGEVSYDNLGKFQAQINKHLAHQFVRDSLDFQRAIKLMAAFPIDGLHESLFERYQVRKAIDELTALSRGDIVTFAGGGYDDQGKERPIRALLVGLEETEVSTDWLNTTIREFIRNYTEQSQRTRSLMVHGFQQLLKQEVFKSENWKLLRSLDYTLSQDRTYVFEGAFPNTTRRNYPDRILDVRILGAWESARATAIEGDLALYFVLALHHDRPEQERRSIGGTVLFSEEKVTTLVLNMSHNSGKERYGDLHSTLDRVVAPWKITPALLLSLYAYLDEKREANAIPKSDDQTISTLFQPVLLEHALNELFTPDLGAEVGASGVRIIEEIVRRQLERWYGQYKTLMTNVRWKESLRRYHTALEHLPTPFERQGQQLYISPSQGPNNSAKTKQDLATEIFNATVPAVESFIATNPLLIRAEGHGWRFTLHPLETQIMDQLKASPLTEAPRLSGGKPRPVLTREAAWKLAQQTGYREQEFDEAVVLLEKRGLISLPANRRKIIGEETRVPQIAELQRLLADYQSRLQRVKEALKDDPQVARWLQELPSFEQLIARCSGSPDEQMQTRLADTLRTRLRDLDVVIQAQQQQIGRHTAQLVQQATFTQGRLGVLQQPPGEGLFGRQLETQRQSLLKESQKVEEEFSPLREQASEIQTLVRQPSISPDELVRLVQTAQRFQKALLEQQRHVAHIQEMISYYDQAHQLLRLAQEFQERRLQQVPLDMAATFQTKLEAWSLRITGELSSTKLDGLRNEPQWRQEFDALRRDFDQQVQAEQDRFTSTQEDYKRFLLSKYPQVRLWAEVLFNPAQPQDSYTRLWDGVHEVLKQAVELARKEVLALYDRAARLQGGSLATLPPFERPEAQARLDDIQSRLRQHQETTTKWVEQVMAENFMDPVRERGMTTPAEVMLNPIVLRITKLKKEVVPDLESQLGELEQRVLKAKLSPEEEQILAELTLLQQNNGGGDELELGLLLQGAADQRASWRLLESLYAKQRLRIKIARVVFE